MQNYIYFCLTVCCLLSQNEIKIVNIYRFKQNICFYNVYHNVYRLLGPNSCLYQHLFIIQSISLDKIMFYYICFEHSFCFKWFSTTLNYKTKFLRVCELVVFKMKEMPSLLTSTHKTIYLKCQI